MALVANLWTRPCEHTRSGVHLLSCGAPLPDCGREISVQTLALGTSPLPPAIVCADPSALDPMVDYILGDLDLLLAMREMDRLVQATPENARAPSRAMFAQMVEVRLLQQMVSLLSWSMRAIEENLPDAFGLLDALDLSGVVAKAATTIEDNLPDAFGGPAILGNVPHAIEPETVLSPMRQDRSSRGTRQTFQR